MTEFEEHLTYRSFGMIGHGMDDKEFAWVNFSTEVVTFPLWNLSGELLGYQEYKWNKPKTRGNHPKDQKYFTYLPKETIGLYGLQLLPEGYKGTIYLVEGIWEVIMGWAYNIPCIAMLGSDNKQAMNWVKSLPNKVRPLCQPDKAGKKLAKFGEPIYLEGDLDDCLHNGGWYGVPWEEIEEA